MHHLCIFLKLHAYVCDIHVWCVHFLFISQIFVLIYFTLYVPYQNPLPRGCVPGRGFWSIQNLKFWQDSHEYEIFSFVLTKGNSGLTKILTFRLSLSAYKTLCRARNLLAQGFWNVWNNWPPAVSITHSTSIIAALRLWHRRHWNFRWIRVGDPLGPLPRPTDVSHPFQK